MLGCASQTQRETTAATTQELAELASRKRTGGGLAYGLVLKMTETTNILSKEQLRGLLAQWLDQPFCYLPNPGNAGDAAIAAGTYLLMDELRLPYVVAEHWSHCDRSTVVYAGGGNLVEGLYKEGAEAVRSLCAAGKEVIILPHTIFGYAELFLQWQLQLTVICREETSYKYLLMIGFPPERLYLAHDMAFYLEEYASRLIEEVQSRKQIGYCLRTDGESGFTHAIPHNFDISLTWNGPLWGNKKLAFSVTDSLLSYISDYHIIVTDRLHVGILSALAGKRTLLLPNSYYKNEAVYLHSLEDRTNVQFVRYPGVLTTARTHGDELLARAIEQEKDIASLAHSILLQEKYATEQ